MSKIFDNHGIATPRMSEIPPLYESAYATARAVIHALILLSRVSPELAAEFAGAVVRGVYGAGAALGLPLPIIHLTPEA